MNVTVHLGVFRRCNYLAKSDYPMNSVYLREECGRYKSFDDIPSTAWQASTIMLGMACGILVLVSLTMCFKDIITKQTARVCGFFQALAGTKSHPPIYVLANYNSQIRGEIVDVV